MDYIVDHVLLHLVDYVLGLLQKLKKISYLLIMIIS
jgi:hypothetical protein